MGFDSGAGAGGGGGSVATDVIYDAKGDLPVGTGANTAARLPVGANGKVLMADSGQATGVKWETPAAGGDFAVPVPVGSYVAPPGPVLTGVAQPANGELVLTRMPVKAMSVDRIGVEIGTAGSVGAVLRFALYTDADNDGIPDTLLVDGGTAVATGTGIVTVSFSPVAVAAGQLWGGVVSQGAPATPPKMTGVTADPYPLVLGAAPVTYGFSTIAWVKTGVTGAAPASIVPADYFNPSPRWAVRAA